MATLGGREIEVDDGGYLTNPDDWDESVAKDLAASLNIELTDKHFEVINLIYTS